jgi:hypothetical protein
MSQRCFFFCGKGGGGRLSNEPQAAPSHETFKALSKRLEFSDGMKIEVANDVPETCPPSFDTANSYSCSLTCAELPECGKRGVLIHRN